MTITGAAPASPITLAALAAQLATGQQSSRALVEDCLARIDDPAGEGRRTYLQVDREAALASADAIDARRARGERLPAYAGIPVSIKDLFDIAGQVTRAGSTVLSDRAPATADALSVARLRRAGLVLIGRTNMTEFAFSGLGLNPHYGTPLNPWQRVEAHIPGGSSCGAAISVVDGMAHGALGTDTGGSCRIPAAFTGLVGFKPTARRVPRDGLLPLSPSLDSIGPIARSVDCCAQLDALLADERPPQLAGKSLAGGSPADGPLAGRRFCVPRTLVQENMDRHVAADFERALARLSAGGALLREIEIAEFAQLSGIHARGALSNAESYALHRSLLATRGDEYDQRVRRRIEIGAAMTAADYIDLLQARQAFIAGVTASIADYDAWLMPTVPVIAPRLAELVADEQYLRLNALVLRNSTLVNFLDGCAISIPIHARGQPPVGLTLASRGGSDPQLLRHAAAAEAALALSA
jgi:aspartyl-tRNA(Asn)/glutamyl-tRNA(Gln) amidotransferase subunit A